MPLQLPRSASDTLRSQDLNETNEESVVDMSCAEQESEPCPESQSHGEPRDSEDYSDCEDFDEDLSDEDFMSLSQKKKTMDSSQSTDKLLKIRGKKVLHRPQGSVVTEIYSAAGIKKFLQETKGMRSVKVDNFFPNLK